MSVKVFTSEELLEAIKNNDKKPVLVIEKKKENTPVKGTKFYNARFNIGTFSKASGWFTVKNIVLSIGVADPSNANDKRNEFEGTRLQFQTTVSRAGVFGQALLLLNPIFIKQIEDLNASGVAPIGNRQIHELVQSKVAESNEKAKGTVIDDPIIRMKVDFTPFPAKYQPAFLAGQPKTQIFDYTTQYKDNNGKMQYKLATVYNPKTKKEEPVGKDNLHLFATKGSIIHEMRITWSSVPYSSSWVSFPITVTRVVMTQGPPEGFSDEGADDEAVANALQPPTPPPATHPNKPDEKGTLPPAQDVAGSTDLTDNDIENALNGEI